MTTPPPSPRAPRPRHRDRIRHPRPAQRDHGRRRGARRARDAHRGRRPACVVPPRGPVRTGVTVIRPHAGLVAESPVFAGFHSTNGNGEMTGIHWLRESGLLTSAIAITNTHSVGAVHEGLVAQEIADRDARPRLLLPARRRRDVRRLPQRRQRAPRPSRACAPRIRRRARGARSRREASVAAPA